MQCFVRAMAIAVAFLCMPAATHAQGRNQPIRFIVPYPPGGATDQITRLVAHEAANALGTPIVVENKAGGAGMIAAETVARAEPDGRTFLIGSNGPLVINSALFRKLPYDPVKDFVPVAGLGKTPLLLAIRPGLPVKSVAELVALGKKEPGKLTMGSAGNGNISHLAGEYTANALGFKATLVPYGGSAPAIISLVGGNIDLLFDALPSSLQQVRAGKIRALAILDATRFALLPDVPTLRELGFPNTDASAWFGVVAPARTPEPVIARLSKAINVSLRQPALIEKLQAIGAQPLPATPEEFGRLLTEERAKWIPVANTLGLKAD